MSTTVEPGVLDEFFPYMAQMIISMSWCDRSSDFAIKVLKYGTACHAHSVTTVVLDGFFSYLAQIIIRVRMCLRCNYFDPLGEVYIQNVGILY